MRFSKTKLPIRSLTLAALLALALPASVPAADGKVQLSQESIRKICARYEGQPAFVSDGKTILLSCGSITDMAGDLHSMLLMYRDILSAAGSIAGLQRLHDKGRLPPDLDCGDFVARSTGPERVLACQSHPLGVDVPFTFRATMKGDLVSVEARMPVRRLKRLALEGAVHRGTITSFFDAFVELENDLMVEALRQTAGSADAVSSGPDGVSMRVARPRVL